MKKARRPDEELAERNPWKWVIAFLLAVVSHGVWLFWLDTTWVTPRDTAAAVPPMHLVTWPYDDDDSPHALRNVLGVWSAATFSLPSEVGFSRSLLREEIRLRPPLHSPSESAMLLDRERVRRSETELAVTLPAWDELRVYVGEIPLRDVPAPAPREMDPAALPAAPRVEYHDSANEREPETIRFSEEPGMWGEEPWAVDLTVYIDRWGAVDRVVMEQRTPYEEVDGQLLRDVHRWRWTPGTTNMMAQVRVTYPGDTVENARSEEAP